MNGGTRPPEAAAAAGAGTLPRKSAATSSVAAAAQAEPDISEFIPPPVHRKVMAPGTFPRPSYRNALTVSAGYAAVLSAAPADATPRTFFHRAAVAAAAVAAATSSAHEHGKLAAGSGLSTTAAAAVSRASPAGGIPRTTAAAGGGGGRADRLPSIHGLFAHTVDAERKMCSLEYWLSIFGTTGGTVRHAGASKQFPIEVLNGLFVGDDTCASSIHALADHNIRHVINAAADKYVPLKLIDPAAAAASLRKAGLTYLALDGLVDSAGCEILPFLGPACEAIAKARAAGEAVLVCSSKGTNRSVCIVMAYLIHSDLVAASIRKAAAVVKEVHPSARVSRRFIYDLDKFMDQLDNAKASSNSSDSSSSAISTISTTAAAAAAAAAASASNALGGAAAQSTIPATAAMGTATHHEAGSPTAAALAREVRDLDDMMENIAAVTMAALSPVQSLRELAPVQLAPASPQARQPSVFRTVGDAVGGFDA